jgi:hypothetical protein
MLDNEDDDIITRIDQMGTFQDNVALDARLGNSWGFHAHESW